MRSPRDLRLAARAMAAQNSYSARSKKVGVVQMSAMLLYRAPLCVARSSASRTPFSIARIQVQQAAIASIGSSRSLCCTCSFGVAGTRPQ